jgi:hypothetical protein
MLYKLPSAIFTHLHLGKPLPTKISHLPPSVNNCRPLPIILLMILPFRCFFESYSYRQLLSLLQSPYRLALEFEVTYHIPSSALSGDHFTLIERKA